MIQIGEGLRSEDNHTRFVTFCRARELGPETIEPAAEVIFDPGTVPLMRYWATELVAAFALEKPHRSREILLGSLSDPSPLVRAAALRGLAAFTDEVSIMCIRTHMEDHTEIPDAWAAPYSVSAAAQASLTKIAAAMAHHSTE